MLATCLAMGWSIENYCDSDHPLQRLIGQILESVTGCPALGEPQVDGCSAPTFSMPIHSAARAFARLADPSHEPPKRRAALDRVFNAMRAHPWHVAGTDRSCTSFMAACPDVVVKVGAEGFYGLALRRRGIGIALKVDDGAERAGYVLAGALLEMLNAVSPDQTDEVARWSQHDLRNSAGTSVGRAVPARGWLEGVHA